MELLQKRSTLEQQSGRLLGYLDALFRRLVLPRQAAEEPSLDCSREEIRALILLRISGRTIMSDFAGELGVPLSTATHTIDRLVAKGLVTRVRSELDRRRGSGGNERNRQGVSDRSASPAPSHGAQLAHSAESGRAGNISQTDGENHPEGPL